MATASALKALRVPGELFVDGVSLGLVRDVLIEITEGQSPIHAEEFGTEHIEMLYMGERVRVVFALRGWDQDAVAATFVNNAGGFAEFPGTKPAGYVLSQDKVALTFTPVDPSYPALVAAAAIPLRSTRTETALSKSQEFLLLCSFLMIRDGATPEGSTTWGV